MNRQRIIQKLIKAKAVLIFSLTFCCVLISCNSNYDTLISEYNESFPKALGNKPVPDVTSPSFNWSRMIPQPLYSVKVDYYLCLTAPKGCQSYTWILEEVETEKKNEISKKRTLVYKPDDIYILGLETDPENYPSRLGKKFVLTLKAMYGGISHESSAELYFVENK